MTTDLREPSRVAIPTPGVAALARLLGMVAVCAWGDETIVPIVELSDSDVERIDLHDASTEDWAFVVGDAATLTAARDFTVDIYSLYAGYDPYDPSDLDFRIWMGWHDATNRIYVAVERADDVRLPEQVWELDTPESSTGAGLYHQDSVFEFTVDGDARYFSSAGFEARCDQPRDKDLNCESSKSREARRDAANRETQWYVVLGDLDGPWRAVYLYHNNYYLPYDQSWFVEPPYADGGGGHFGEQPVISISEFYVRAFDRLVWDDEEASVVSDLRAGGRVHFRMKVTDRDLPYEGISRGNADTALYFPYLDTRQFYKDDYYAVGVLLGHDGWRPTVRTDSTSTWGRLKQSLRPRLPW